jgi:hypothetical protein
VIARELDNQFEWAAHEPAALAEGLAAPIIEVVKRRKPVARLGKRLGTKEGPHHRARAQEGPSDHRRDI